MNMSMSSVSMTGMSAMQSRGAPPPPPPPSDETGQTDTLSQFDLDEDGSLSTSEISESPLSEDNWSSVDTDGNGSLSETELTAHRDSMAEASQMGGKGGPGGRGGPPMGGGMISEVDTTSLFEGLVSDAEDTTETGSLSASSSAEELYSEMQSLLGVLA
ncbi:hypothetical protein R3X27_05315 [Tropicimonas sp. TH_r6]|uniref:hypothetical protein n=1 Tax=Tropicimonas sp. TH_r6 TaxID=3082085 RepID=UPI00295526CE|nr:hypothetical protein [Tropicimonas sp. TH_r6]MDV7142096.1 hypothetical protein [Tropicimonas sp. TH_r6]